MSKNILLMLKSTIRCAALLIALSACQAQTGDVLLEQPAFDTATLNKLYATQANNTDVIYQQLNLNAEQDANYGLANPYSPYQPLSFFECLLNPNCRYSSTHLLATPLVFPAQPVVYNWYINKSSDATQAAVCAIRFDSPDKITYTLRSFDNLAQLQSAPGFTLTHYQACGVCSTLQDLAVYGEKDLTAMARTCSKNLNPSNRLACMQDIGLSTMCATAWAYNSQHTAQHCALSCIKTYGLLNVLLNTEDASNTDEFGNLNACLQCDESLSGPGFQYYSGRTRRNSGINSEIDRPSEEVYEVSHDYF